MTDELLHHLQPREGDSRRILALDGGGVRGLVSLGILARIEAMLAARSARKDDFRLCDYFDLIAGTSTGAIIAAALATGMRVGEVVTLYKKLCPAIFRQQARGLLKPVFGYKPLEEQLKVILADEQLQSKRLRTGLMVCAKRIDTGAPWVLTNNPKSKYWNSPDNSFRPNSEYELWRIVRASAAAPHYFEPVEVTINEKGNVYPEQIGLFVDGAVGGFNNPSVQALLTVGLPAYGFSWPRGKDKLLMISVGTGWWRHEHDRIAFKKLANWHKTVHALSSLIQDTSLHAIVTMQALGTSRKPWWINGEIGNMRGERLVDKELLTFQRFDAKVDLETVRRVCVMRRPTDRRLSALVAALRELANADPKNMDYLYALGHDVGTVRTAGVDGIEPEDFPAVFDPRTASASTPHSEIAAAETG
jgi:hypothetical protein